MNLVDFKNQLNEWGRDKVPFLFIIDFECERPRVWRLDDIGSNVLYYFNGLTNGKKKNIPEATDLNVTPVRFDEFKQKFDCVLLHLTRGDSFLTNLTFKSQLETDVDLQLLFYQASAKYKLWLEGEFLFFSPETYIQIEDGLIKTFPMKGTIDASIENASEVILSDEKEMAEHITIVDLLRNDLAQVSSNVEVKRFRYIEAVKSKKKSILQVSSEIVGQLPADYSNNFGDILISLLPAGSISGAPKRKTIEIIKNVEGEPRGYYTGVAGIYDGKNFDSCVMIRFIECVKNKYYYRSGGGITSRSKLESEYQEMLNKIYVPIN